MKMNVDFFDNKIYFDIDYINVIEIENKIYFYRFINSLNNIINNGFSDDIIFFNNDIEKNMNGKIRLFIDYFNLGFDSKKYEKDINKYINESINEEEI